MSGSGDSKDDDAIIIHAVTKKRFFEQRLNPTTQNYDNIWNTILPKPEIVISLSGKNTLFSARPWYSAAFREVMLETMFKFGDFWILSSVSCKCVRTLVEDFKLALRIRGFEKNDEKIPTVEELYGATCPADPDPDPDPDQRIKFEKYLSDQKVPMLDGSHQHMTGLQSNLQMKVPVVVFVVEGDIQTLEHVTASIENNIPVVVIQGSGKMADVIAECMMGQDEVDKILSRRASNLLGCYIDAHDFMVMQENLKKIMDKHWLVQVFRIHEVPPKDICHVISELIMTTWGVAPDHYSSSQQNSKKTNDPVVKQDKQLLVRNNSVAKKSLSKRPVSRMDRMKHKPKEEQEKSKPLPEFFSYLACQFLQDKNELATSSESQNLLFEALIGNDIELVQTLLSYDVGLNPSLLKGLYKEALGKPERKNYAEQEYDVDDYDFGNCKLYSIHKSFKKGAAEKLAAGSDDTAADSNKRAEDFNKRAADSNKRAADSNKRAADSNKRAADSNKRAADSNKRAADSNKTAADSNKRAADSNKTAADSNKRAADSNKTAADSNKRAADSNKTAADSNKRAADSNKIAADSNKRVADSNKRAADSNKTAAVSNKTAKDSKTAADKEMETIYQAIGLLQSILNYGRNVKNNDLEEKYFNIWKFRTCKKLPEIDLMLWSVLTHRPAIAEIFWRRGKYQILSALMASITFKEMAKIAEHHREKELAEEIEASSRLFQQNAVDLVNELYQQDMEAVYNIIYHKNKFTLWGITTNVTTMAHNNDMMDFISTTAVQRYVTGVWYNDFENNDHFWKMWYHPWQALTAPITKFMIHYIVYIIFLITASNLVLTGIYPVERPYTWPFISIWEWVLICYVFSDIFEEINSNIFNSGLTQVCKGRGPRLGFRLKRWLTDFWNLLDVLSYISLLALLAAQFLWDHEKATRRFFCLSLLFFYLRLMVIFIPCQKLGVIVMMIKEMLKDLLWFLPILAVFVVAFGIVYHSLMFPNHADLFHGSWEYWRIWRMLYIPYWQIYGESFLEAIEGKIMPDNCAKNFTVWYEDPSRERCPNEDWMSPIISTVYVLICNLLLVNLVIAMFSRTFQCVKENSQKIWCHYRFSMVLEHQYRIPPPFNIVLRPLFWIIGLPHTISYKLNRVCDCSIKDNLAMFVKQGAEKCLLSRKRKEWLAQKSST